MFKISKGYIQLILSIAAAGLFLLGSCKRPDEKLDSWDVGILAPLAKTTLSLDALINDSLFEKDSDSLLSIVYRHQLYEAKMSDFLRVPDTTIRKSVSLKNLELASRTLSQGISLGTIASTAGLAGAVIIANNGNSLVFPPFTTTSPFQIDVDANEFFTTATMNDGFMDLEIKNEFPVDITDAAFRLKNKSDGSIIVQDTFFLIPANGGVASKTISLAGKTIEGNMVAEVLTLSSPGSSGPVLIDTSQQVIVTLTVRNLKPFSATAVFPAQNLIDDKQDVLYDMGGPLLTFMKIRSGIVKLEVASTIPETMHVRYTIPFADLNGQAVDINMVIPPAPPNDTSWIIEDFDLAGYTVDLRGKDKNKSNTFYNTLVARIDSSGKLVSISLSDSIYLFYGLLNIVPEYAIGYMGQDTFSIGPDIQKIAIFDKITDGNFSMQNVKVKLTVENGLGVDGRVVIKNLATTNTLKSNYADLTGSAVSTPFNISRGSLFPLLYSTNSVEFNNGNSNISQLVENLPDQLEYKVDIFTNPNGHVSNFNDFVHYDSRLRAMLDISVPLDLISNNLTLADTIDFKLGSDDNTKNISGGNLKLLVDNGFPLQATVRLYMLDEFGHIIGQLHNEPDNVIGAATINQSVQRVNDKSRSVLLFPVNQDKIGLLKLTRKVLVKVSFTTQPANTGVKIFSDYEMDVKLIGDFTYNTNP
jgi:hypothetical protein